MLSASVTDVPVIMELSGGEFWMGQDDGRDDEQPVHRVRISPFGLARTQVTNAQYDCFCRATGRLPPKFRKTEGFDTPDQPVAGTSWFDAVSYCEWLTAATSRYF